ncbi:hypothetical protein BVRB_5g123770 [Beta vulgaris subsp. vulgaris]|nr:hypothetical protein BVRB_5g123770 [Beta vulgaris subsp. vulgaris]
MATCSHHRSKPGNVLTVRGVVSNTTTAATNIIRLLGYGASVPRRSRNNHIHCLTLVGF